MEMLFSNSQAAYYSEDVAALQGKSIPEEDRWTAKPVTSGFRNVREVAEVLSVGIALENGQVAWGDCVGVSYSGKAGRDPIFRGDEAKKLLQSELSLPRIETSSFKELSKLISSHWPRAVCYGVSQMLLQAVALSRHKLPVQVVCEEWKLAWPTRAVPIQGSCGNDRKRGADKMIVNALAALPHGQIDDIASQFGKNGEILIEYVGWLVKRIQALGPSGYSPTIHLDVHGAIGKAFENNVDRMAEYLGLLKKSAGAFPLRVESAVVLESRDKTLEMVKKLKSRQTGVKLVVDEWANTKDDILLFAKEKAADMIHIKMPDLGGLDQSIDAVLECKKLGVETLLGGSCIETEISSRLCVHVALATGPTCYLAKPGMGIDEAIMLTRNEMGRVLAEI